MMEESSGFLSERLSSSVQVVGQPMAGVESVAVGLLIGTGARDEATNQFGISHFTEQMLFRGTSQFDARALSERFDSLGASYDSSAGLEMTLVNSVLVGTRLSEALPLIFSAVREPSFLVDEVENVRQLLLQEIDQREDQPAQRVMDMLRQNFFADSPISHDVLGTSETISAIDRAAIADYWGSRYTANNAILSVAGNFQWQDVLDQIRNLTDDWNLGAGRLQMSVPAPHPGTAVVHKDSTQENLGFAFPCVSVSDPDYYVAALISLALGGSSYSRLFREVRDNRGLAYAVQSRFDGLEKTGIVRIYVGTSAERAHESVQVVVDELRKLESGGLTEDELAVSKTRLKSQLIMRSESSSARMLANVRSWWFEQRLRSLDEIRAEIDAVTTERVNDLIGRLHISDNLAAVALGPRTEDELFAGVFARS